MNITNPLDYPRYVRSLRPALPESLPLYVDGELDKLSQSIQTLEEAVTNEASARIEEERIVRATADEALAARIVTVEAKFDGELADATAKIEDEEIARSTATEALASRITAVQAEFTAETAATNAVVKSEQLARATADEALASRIDTVEATYRSANASVNARVGSEVFALVTADEAMATRVDTLEAEFDTETASINARITNEETVRANADSALATTLSSVSATTNANTAAITAEQTARANGDSALASQISSLTTTVNTNTAAITTEQTVRSDADSALASSLSTLTTTVNGHTSTITTHASSINGLQAKYGVKLNVNGYVTGFEQNNGGTSSDFTIIADNFLVVTPGFTPVTPFSVTASGVRIQGNLIVTGSITGTQISDNAVGTPKIAAGSIGVPINVDGTDTFVSAGSTVNVIDTSWFTVGDSTDGGAFVMVFAEIDTGTETDVSTRINLYIDTGSGYTLYGTTSCGILTAGADTKFKLPLVASASVDNASSIRVRLQIASLPFAPAAARSVTVRSPKVVIMGAKR